MTTSRPRQDEVRITDRSQLTRLARHLKVRPDWHEPDEQEVSATVHGNDLDNAGFWGTLPDGSLHAYGEGRQELWVEITQNGRKVAEVNLATLLAWAAEDR